MLTLRTISITLLTLSAFSGSAADIIVESRPGGINHTGYRETAGRWLDSNTPADTAKSSAPGLTPQGVIGSRKATVVPDSGTPEQVLSAARFTPTIEQAGDYFVYVTFPKAANATPVTIYVKHASGEETKEITQDGWGFVSSPNSNEWIEIGKFPFSPGNEQFVEVRVTGATGATDPGNPPQAFADAVRFSTEQVPIAKAAAPAAAGQSGQDAPASSAAAAPDDGSLQWVDDLAAGRTAASSENKKLFVFFYSPQSSRSTDYENRVLNNPQVKGVIKAGFVPVRINMETERQLTAQLQVFRAGTINVYDSATGNGLEHINDTPPVDELVKRLNAVK